MESSYNITAPLTFNARQVADDVSKTLNVFVSQEDAKANC